LVVSLNSGNREPVLALAQSVSVGQVLTAQDLKQVNVAVDPGVSVVDASQAASVVGKTMSTSLSAGALLTPDAVGTSGFPTAGQALAALSLKSGQFPPEVAGMGVPDPRLRDRERVGAAGRGRPACGVRALA